MTTKDSEDIYDPFDQASQKVEEPKFNSSDFDFDIINDGLGASANTTEEKKKILDPFAAGAKLAQEFHKNMKVQRVRISEEERASMESKYDISLVNDFDDDYALTDEELRSKTKFYDLYRKIANSRKNLRSMSDYVRVCRDAVAFLKAVADDNVMYDPDDFVEMVLTGKIVLAGFEIPRYKGKNRNHIDWGVVAKYIMNPELNANDTDVFDKYSDISPDDDVVLTESEYRNIMRVVARDCPEMLKNTPQKGSKKKIKLSSKGEFKDLVEFNAVVKKKEQRVSEISSMNSRSIRDFVHDDIEEISKATKKKLPSLEKPMFTGDVTSEKDYDEYLKTLEAWEADNAWTKTPNGMAIRKGDATIRELKNIFEEFGYDVSNMYQETLTERRDKYLMETRKAINIDKIKLDAMKKELKFIIDKYESEEILRVTSERQWTEYKKRKKEVKRLERDIAEREETRKRREKMSDKEFAKDVEEQKAKVQKADKKKAKKERKKSESSYKDIDGGVIGW